LRPGQFGVHLQVGLPDAADRAEILRVHLRQATKLHALQRNGFAAESALTIADFEVALADFSAQRGTLA
jgi:SpoVK/Ycf46/Vps4 family AAA+-type ATPase